MAPSTTLYMTPEESERVRKTVQDRTQKCQDLCGQPREASDPKGLIETAVSASLMQDISFGLGGGKKKETMVAYAVGCQYLPSVAKLEDLKPMKISELCMETQHRGRVLSLRRVSPVVELKMSSWAAVQDTSSDDVERLELFLHTSNLGQDVLDVGSEFLVKEPYYTLNNLNEPVIRIDHPSDLLITVQSDGPESWRRTENTDLDRTKKTALEFKAEGNAALQKKDFARAHAGYTKGLKVVLEDEEAHGTLLNDLYRNRSHVNLALGRLDEAKSDALASLTHGEEKEQKELDAKAYYRAGTASYSMGDFDEARGFFEKQEKLQPGNQLASINLKKIKLRLRERETGAYDLQKIVGTLAKTQGRPDVASFNGCLEIRESPGAGRGLFATRDIEPREIVMAEKAFCLAWSHEPETFTALACDIRDDAAIKVFPAGLLKTVMQRLLNNPSQIEKVLHLCGEYEGLGEKIKYCDGRLVLDTFQIHDIIQQNAFSAGQQTEDEDVTNASTGLWPRSSYMNHSCVSNSEKSCVGDLMIIRATRRIAAGEELTHAYDEASDLEARKAALKRTWGFECHCKLCAAEEADGPEVRKQRRELEKESDAFMQQNAPGGKKISVSKARRLRQSINDTYNKERYEGLPRWALRGIEHWLQAG